MQSFYKRSSVVAAFGLLLAVLVINAFFMRRQFGVQMGDEAWVMHSRQVLSEAQQTESLLKDAETGQRGFLITGDPEYLAPYSRAAGLIKGHIDNLAPLTADNPSQQERTVQLRALADGKLRELAGTISLYQSGNSDDARATVLSHLGKSYMNDIRWVIAQMEQEESSLETARTANYQKSQRNAVASIYGASCLAAFGLILLAYYVLREMRLREKHAQEIGEREERYRVTLAGIGDAVIATDAEGRVTFANQVALGLMGWPEAEIRGKALDSVFQIVNEFTREKVESPVDRVLREGKIVGLANHTVLIARDGTEVPIDDSAAPIRGGDGTVQGAVLVFRDITERRRAEGTSELLSSIVESSEDAIISKNANGIITSWNDGAKHLFGYSAQEMIGEPISMLAPPDRQDEMRETLERVRRGEQVKHYDTVRRTKSGTPIHVSVSVSPIRDPSGRIVGGSKVARDVSEQVEAQRELAAQREQLSGIIDSAMDAILTVDQSQQIKLFNGAAERVFQCSASEALGHSLDVFIPERFRQAHRKHIEQFGEAGTTSRNMSRPGVLWGLRKNGKEFPLEASISQIESDGEKLFTVILRDITERKRVEDDLHRERERLGLALTASTMGVYEMNLVTGILWWSPETYSLFGIKPEEFSLTRDSFAELIHPADRELFMQYWDENIAQRQPVNHEFRILLPDGKERWLSCKGLILAQYDDGRQPLRHTGIFLDITERKVAEQILRKFEKLSAAARLSAAVAHEINNPLSAVVNLIYIAKGAPGVPPSVAEQLTLAEEELERVAHATRQALGFYRESAAPEKVDMSALIESVLKLYSNKLAAKKIRVERVLSKCAPISAARGELRQAVSNLILNAVEAVSEGGSITVGVHSVTGSKGEEVEVIIADDGPGISSENVERIFEPFFTTKAGTGTGLGLWVTKEILERHGGSIHLVPRGDGGRGAAFTIVLPCITE